MSRGKIFLAIVVALVVCLGAGFIWGNSGRSTLQTTLDDAKLQLDLAEARGDILDGRVSLYNNNFGDASRHFESAKAPLQRLQQRYANNGKREAASSIDASSGLNCSTPSRSRTAHSMKSSRSDVVGQLKVAQR